MTYLPPMVLAASAVVENAIAVNSAGVRFHDEARSFDDRIAALRARDGRRAAWYILDAESARAQAYLIEQLPQTPVRRQPQLTTGFAEARSRLTEQWSRGQEASTEDLRQRARAPPRLLSNSCCR
jgi:hypothetical protein